MTDNLFAALERIFHEPNRLAIMSSLCTTSVGLTFTELKTQCSLTDGNLNRHLKVLEEARAISIKKEFVANRPQTTVFLTEAGRTSFLDYLNALEQVLKKAARAAQTSPAKRSSVPTGRTARA